MLKYGSKSVVCNGPDMHPCDVGCRLCILDADSSVLCELRMGFLSHRESMEEEYEYANAFGKQGQNIRITCVSAMLRYQYVLAMRANSNGRYFHHDCILPHVNVTYMSYRQP